MEFFNKERRLKIALIAVIIFLFFPLINLFKFITPVKLNGISVPDRIDEFSVKSFLKRKYQKDFEIYAVRNNPLWGLSLKAGNQIYFSLFNQISPRLNNSVLVGEKGYFFQSQYLPSFNKSKSFKKERADDFLKSSFELQEKLKDINVDIVYLISPNLISLYPEFLPESYKDPTRFSRQNSYEYLLPLMEASPINIVNSFEKFKILKDNVPYRFFPKTGSHLNELGVCHQINLIYDLYATKINKKYLPIDCNSFLETATSVKDSDLIDIANLLLPKRTMEKSLTLNDQKVGFEGDFKPRVLLVGTSFLFDIQKQLERFNLVHEAPLLFYFKHIRDDSKQKLKKINKGFLSKSELANYDLIILETNQGKVSAMGSGFIDSAIKALK